jgi:hypothetical protein
MSKYAELRKIDVSSKIEKKNGLSYLSWAWACDQLLQQDPTATWVYNQPVAFGETLMVFCTVTAFGKSMTAQLPVMDYRNKAIPNPDAFAVNTAMQRCLAKAIALHGIGLYIYAGEDVPQEEPDPVDATELVAKIASSKDIEELKTNFAYAYKVANKDKEALKLINDAKETRKAELA